MQRRIELPGDYDLSASLAVLSYSKGDPSVRVDSGDVCIAWETGTGPATLHLRQTGARTVDAEAWGEGAEAALEQAPAICGVDDDPAQLQARHRSVREAAHRTRLRLPATGRLAMHLMPAILGQLVVGADARRSHRQLVRRFGSVAPGPVPMMLPPSAQTLVSLPYWEYHRCGIDQRHAAVVVETMRRARRIDALTALPAEQAMAALQKLPGIGPWTAATAVALSHGDPDTVLLGDYHLPDVISWNLAGQARADDQRMLELLEPYRGQRGRVIRLLMTAGTAPPRFGPRSPRRDIRFH